MADNAALRNKTSKPKINFEKKKQKKRHSCSSLSFYARALPIDPMPSIRRIGVAHQDVSLHKLKYETTIAHCLHVFYNRNMFIG